MMKSLVLPLCKNAHSLILLVLFSGYCYGTEPLSESLALIERFEEVYLAISIEEQEEPLAQLLAEAESYRDNNKGNAEAWIACGIIRSAYAATQGIRALGIFKKSRAEFEAAIELDKYVLGGFALAFLGRLYVALPSWPLSYGSMKKAAPLLQEALAIDAESMANNCYYATYLISDKAYQDAEEYLLRAKSATPRLQFPNWDAVLLRDINASIESLQNE